MRSPRHARLLRTLCALLVLAVLAACATDTDDGDDGAGEEPGQAAGDGATDDDGATDEPTADDGGAAGEQDGEAAGDGPEPEVSELSLGLSVFTWAFAPFYWAEEQGFWEDAGLAVELVEFRAGGDALQAFTGGAVDALASGLGGAINAITSGQEITIFWGGMNAADFAWYTQEGYGWDDVEGIGITSPGSLTDYLARFVVEQQGLEPEADVQIVQVGPPTAGLTALRAGEIDATFLSPPTKYIAEDEGFTLLALQSEDVAPEWPKDVMFTRSEFLEENPGTVIALARGFSEAVTWAEENRDEAIEIMASRFEAELEHAERGYDELMGVFAADGRLPVREAMDVFWDSMVAAGDVDAELPLEEWWDNSVREALGYTDDPIPD